MSITCNIKITWKSEQRRLVVRQRQILERMRCYRLMDRNSKRHTIRHHMHCVCKDNDLFCEKKIKKNQSKQNKSCEFFFVHSAPPKKSASFGSQARGFTFPGASGTSRMKGGKSLYCSSHKMRPASSGSRTLCFKPHQESCLEPGAAIAAAVNVTGLSPSLPLYDPDSK